MRTFQQNWARIAFPHPQPAGKKRLLPPLFENERSPQAEFNEMCVHESPGSTHLHCLQQSAWTPMGLAFRLAPSIVLCFLKPSYCLVLNLLLMPALEEF